MVCTSVQSPTVLIKISITFQLPFLLTFLSTGLAMPPRSLATREDKDVLAVTTFISSPTALQVTEMPEPKEFSVLLHGEQPPGIRQP